jgi:RNA polymerase sigma-70 factor (ECF subfamily)
MQALLAERGILLAYINVMLRDLHGAEDILQEALLLAMDQPFVDANHARAWIRATARNLALAERRRRGRGAMLSDDVLQLLEPAWREEAGEGAHGERIAALRACCDGLSEAARRLLDLRFQGGLDGQAIAARIGRPLNTVYVGLSRIYRRLAECIQRRLEDA